MLLNRISAHCRTTHGYSLIELIVVLAGISLLTSLVSTRFNDFFQGMETDETMAHLNAVSSKCLRDLANNSNNPKKIEAEPDTELLEKNGYEIDATHKNCHYLQINPKVSSSESHFKMGFGIFNGNVTKYAISDDKTESECKRWAGDNCIIDSTESETDSFDEFFDHMESVRAARITCENTFKAAINSSLARQELTRWDAQKNSKCLIEKPARNSEVNYPISECSTGGCNKTAYVKSGEFVGYSETDYDAAQSAACSASISAHLEGLSTDHAPEQKNDLADCGSKTYYFCEQSYTDNQTNYDNCKINQSIKKCKIELEARRSGDNGSVTTTEQGLAPCGTRYICNNAIYNSIDESPCKPPPACE